jgi:hypothetical protein
LLSNFAAAGFIDPTQTIHIAFHVAELAKKKKKNATV